MIGADTQLQPGTIQIKRKPLANALGVTPPRYVSEGTVQDAQNNAIAQGYRTPRVQAGRGFSNSKYTRAQQGIQDAASMGAAANQAAAIGAEAEAYNASIRDQYDQMRDSTLANRRSHDLSIHDALMGHRNNERQMNQQLQLGNETQRDRLKYSLLGRML
jgi:hypothetical protein